MLMTEWKKIYGLRAIEESETARIDPKTAAAGSVIFS